MSQYLRLVEQDWQNPEGHRKLAELALTAQDFATARTHVDAAFQIDPGNAQGRALKATLDFRDGDRGRRGRVARGVVADDPANIAANLVLVADRIEAGDQQAALAAARRRRRATPPTTRASPSPGSASSSRWATAARRRGAEGDGGEVPAESRPAPGADPLVLDAGDLDAAEAMLRADARRAPGRSRRRGSRSCSSWAQLRGAEAARAELRRGSPRSREPGAVPPDAREPRPRQAGNDAAHRHPAS